MNRRFAWAIAALILVALAIPAWRHVDERDALASATASAKIDASPAQATRRDASIPFSPSPIPANAPPGPGVAHTTAPPQAIPPRAPARAMLASLLEQARGKPPNAEAAMTAYDLLLRCRRLSEDPPKEADPNAPDCTGLSAADWRDTGSLLKLAAELGNERAQLTYAQRLVGNLGREPGEVATRDEESAAHEKARQYLNGLAERGNIDAMWFLGESMRAGEVSRPDFVMAYAYKYAVARAGGYPYTIDSELARLEANLSPEEQAKARDFADRLIQRCCMKR